MSKGILIDAVNRTVTEIEVGGLDDMYEAMRVDLVTIGCQLDEINDIFVDDEGLLKSPEHFFYYEGAHQPFAGSGLVLGKDAEGETVSTTKTLAEIKAKVKFLNPLQALMLAKQM